MKSVKINKSELLTIVRDNKTKHVAEALEAVTDYKDAVLKICQDNLKLAKSGDLEKIQNIQHIPSKPTSYEADYSNAIRMLELSVEDVIELDENEFKQLVQDEWTWKRSFSVSNMMYKSFKA